MLGPAGFGSCEGVLLVAPRLQPWYKVVSPRADLREGKPLDAAEFAVHLDQVRTGEAPPDYQEPKRFLERTYLTKSLTELAGEVCRRLSGETVEASAVFNLSTQFGGGKTHALTLLYHLATIGAAADDLPGIRKVLDYGRIASVPKAAVGVFVGTEVDVITGRGGHDGTPRRRTPWGELAYQLGGPEAFRHVAEHEKDPVTAPSSEVIRAFLPDDRPCLILIDELMNYVNRGRSRGLADQVYSFLHTLSEEARRHQNVVLAVSVPASELEMTAEDHADYERLRKLLDRVGKPVAMSAGAETSEIIRRRLFEWEGLPREANKTAGAYAQWVLEHRKQLPQWFPVDRGARGVPGELPVPPDGAVGVRAQVAGAPPLSAHARRAAPAGAVGGACVSKRLPGRAQGPAAGHRHCAAGRSHVSLRGLRAVGGGTAGRCGHHRHLRPPRVVRGAAGRRGGGDDPPRPAAPAGRDCGLLRVKRRAAARDSHRAGDSPGRRRA